MHNDVVEHIFFWEGSFGERKKRGDLIISRARGKGGKEESARGALKGKNLLYEDLPAQPIYLNLGQYLLFFRLQSAERKCSRIVCILA